MSGERKYNPSVLLGALVALSATPGLAGPALHDLAGQLAQRTAHQIASLKEPQLVCIYADGSLLPSREEALSLSQNLALALSSALGGQVGIGSVLEARAATLSGAPERAARAGCDLSLTLILSSQNDRLTVRSLIEHTPKSGPGIIRMPPSSLVLGEPLVAEVALRPDAPAVDLSSGWRMQQIPLFKEDILALTLVDMDQDDVPELYVLSREALVVYRFSPRARPGSPLSPPREIARIPLTEEEQNPRRSRDAVGTLAFSIGKTRELVARTSDLLYSLVFQYQGGKLTKIAQMEPWPLGSYQGEILWGELAAGRNFFTGSIRMGSRTFSSALSYFRLEASPTPQGPLFAVVDKKGALRFALGEPPSSTAASSAEVGAQLLLVDLDQDGRLEVISTSPAPPGAGDVVTFSTLDEKYSLQKLWQSGTLFAPASVASTTKERPRAAVTALAAGDIDADGRLEVITALVSSVGSSILVISRSE